MITTVHDWSNSTVVLHCIRGYDKYKQFIQSRIKHINSKPPINWHYNVTDKTEQMLTQDIEPILVIGCNASKFSKI